MKSSGDTVVGPGSVIVESRSSNVFGELTDGRE